MSAMPNPRPSFAAEADPTRGRESAPASQPNAPGNGGRDRPVPVAPTSGPQYLRVADRAVFTWFHAPAPSHDGAAARASTGVVLCPPWGWNDVTSYRARRAWGEDLAARGFAALRLDLPGTGDSEASAGDADEVEQWIASIAGAVAWLRADAGCRRIAIIGLGLGGLLAGEAIARGASVDDLVLWNAPSRGRTFLRQERAFAALQGSRFSLTGELEPQMLPEGWLEVNGFVLSAPAVEAIGRLDLTSRPTGLLRRALLLDHDGIPVEASIRAHVEASGVDVTVADGPGYEAMCFHPERFDPPMAVFERVGSWLADAEAADATVVAPMPLVRRTVQPVPESTAAAAIPVDGTSVRESPFVVERPFGRLFGILAEPVDAAALPLTAVFLNAGAVRRIGPNRIFVEAARRWAARGVPTLRIDLEGIGDSDGDAGRYRDVGQFYRDELGPEIVAFLDALERHGRPGRFVLAGLCAGGYWSFNAGAADGRATAAFLLNPGALVWDHDLRERRDADRVRRLADPVWWRRLLTGKVRRERIAAIGRAVLSRALRRAGSVVPGARRRPAVGSPNAHPGRNQRERIETLFDRLAARDARVVMAFSNDEPLFAELEANGIVRALPRWPNVRLERLPARDHTLRPIVAQRAVHELLDAALDAEIQRLRPEGLA